MNSTCHDACGGMPAFCFNNEISKRGCGDADGAGRMSQRVCAALARVPCATMKSPSAPLWAAASESRRESAKESFGSATMTLATAGERSAASSVQSSFFSPRGATKNACEKNASTHSLGSMLLRKRGLGRQSSPIQTQYLRPSCCRKARRASAERSARGTLNAPSMQNSCVAPQRSPPVASAASIGSSPNGTCPHAAARRARGGAPSLHIAPSSRSSSSDLARPSLMTPSSPLVALCCGLHSSLFLYWKYGRAAALGKSNGYAHAARCFYRQCTGAVEKCGQAAAPVFSVDYGRSRPLLLRVIHSFRTCDILWCCDESTVAGNFLPESPIL